MSLWPHSLYSSDSGFTPLFRLLDDFDSYSRQSGAGGNGHHHRRGGAGALRHFNPRFDVIENENGYELHGELGGVTKDDINIEFTDPQTIVISGHVQKTYTSGTPPAGLIEGEPKASGAITEAGEHEHEDEHASHRATVEDEVPEGTTTSTTEATPATSALSEAEKLAATSEKKETRRFKYWLSERSVGDFSRTFSFPTRVDQEAVTAGLTNGILTVSIPKAKKQEARRIAVN